MQALNNQALLDAIARMNKEQTRESREVVLDLVISGLEFMAPVTILPGKDSSSNLQLMLLPNQDGQLYFPAFTGWEELRKMCGPTTQKTVALSFDHYANMVLRDNRAAGFVIDPFGCCLSFDRNMISHLVQRQDLQTMPQ